MCAISGVFNKNGKPVIKKEIDSMLNTMLHRGPDDRGFYIAPQTQNIGLGHLRLSIIDLTPDGHQPMLSMDGNLTIVHNGEIYNYIEIREELKKLGHRFQSQSDTEVILEAYKAWGEDCVSHFNGMWAFAIWDEKKSKLFCSRDRFGIKPFFYHDSAEHFLFASEIKGILALFKNKPEVNEQFLYQYIDRSVPFGSNQTVFKSINSLQPAHNLIIEDRKVRIKRYWNFDVKRFRKTYDYSNPQKTFRKLVIDAVKLRLRSDVPVGVCLSGGIDSSVVTGIITKILGQKVNTFSSVYKEPKYNEEEFIDEMNKYCGTSSHKLRPSSDSKKFFTILEKLIYHHDEPVRGPSTFSQWHVFQCAKEKVTVTLDGQGADELLGGYKYYYPAYFATLLRDLIFKGKVRNLKTFLEGRRDVKKYIGPTYNWDTLKYFLPRFLIELKKFIRPSKRWQNMVLSEDFIKRAKSSPGFIPKVYSDPFSQYLFETFTTTNLPMILDFEDRMSMAFSLEARTPFLDYRVVEFCFGLSYEEKMDGYRNKLILREAFKDILPEKIYNRKDKKGFPTPNEHWFRNELKKDLHDIFYSSSFAKHGVFDPLKVQKLFEEHQENANWERILWRVLTIELWMRKYLD